ncbi:hypothetical protein [Imperialibacter sp. EC-SDR9]|nr:hypothetical protein [Imperialibacter sp. EC-SDR9]
METSPLRCEVTTAIVALYVKRQFTKLLVGIILLKAFKYAYLSNDYPIL